MKLSKRELVMLILLIVIALVFVEFRFVIQPGIERYEEMIDENDRLDAELATIEQTLRIAERMRAERDENLLTIDAYNERFLDKLQPSVLLLVTVDLLERNGFSPSNYTIAPLTAVAPSPEHIVIDQISYQLADLAERYQEVRLEAPQEPDESENDTDDEIEGEVEQPSAITQIERVEFSLSATGDYEQIKRLLNDVQRQKKSVLLSQISVNANADETLTAQMTIQYYGIRKIDAAPDVYNIWTRPPFDGGTDSPFGLLTPEATEPLEGEEDEETREEEPQPEGEEGQEA